MLSHAQGLSSRSFRGPVPNDYTEGMSSVPYNDAVQELIHSRDRFRRSTASLTEAISGFAPAPGMMTAAQQVAHVARVIDWFMEGAFSSAGFDMNFEPQIQQVLRVDSIAAAREWFEVSFENAIRLLGSLSEAEWMLPLPPGPVLGGLPRIRIVTEIVEHTAHHRGALSVYTRLNGIEPPDPYGM